MVVRVDVEVLVELVVDVEVAEVDVVEVMEVVDVEVVVVPPALIPPPSDAITLPETLLTFELTTPNLSSIPTCVGVL